MKLVNAMIVLNSFYTVWSMNKTLEYALYIDSLFCEADPCSVGTANINFTVSPEDVPVQPQLDSFVDCCGVSTCSCELPKCHVLGGCCPSVLDHLPTIEESQSSLQSTCGYAQYRPYKELDMANSNYKVWMIRKCYNKPDILDDSDTKKRCEDPGDFGDIFTKTPIVDIQTNYIYQNKYCALCNDVSEERHLFWRVKLACMTGIVNPTDITTVVRDIDKTEDCNILYEIPNVDGYTIPDCKILISTCNETGQWKQYNPFIEAACLAYSKMYAYRYKNVFCYMCNTADETAAYFCWDLQHSLSKPTFVASLDVQDSSEGEDRTVYDDSCNAYNIYDPINDECIPLHCTFPNTVKERECVSTLHEINGVIYEFFIEVNPVGENVTIDTHTTFVELKAISEGWIAAGQFNENGMITSSLSIIRYFTLVEEPLIGTRLTVSIDHAVFGFRWLFSKTTSYSIDYLLNKVDGNTFKIEVAQDHQEPFVAKLSQWYTSPAKPHNSLTNRLYVPDEKAVSEQISAYKYGNETLTRFNGCPHVRIPKERLNVTYIDTKSTFYIYEYNNTISVDDIFIDNTSIYICKDNYEYLVANISRSTDNAELEDNTNGEEVSQTRYTKYIVSYVLVILSLVCAFLTFLVYCCLHELRSQPGVNNMIIAFFLCISQGLFQFGYDTAEYLNPSSCTVLGVFVHYSWLLLLMWMNVCSIHMFRVFFNDQTKSRQNNMLKTTGKYLLYCLTLATIPILINILIFLVNSDWMDIGYGGLFCYIKSSNFTIYILAVPLGLVISFNIIIYIIVIIQIERMKIAPSSNQGGSRRLATAYAKLSTITGMAWLFGIVYMFTEYEWADYTFIALSATQGIFIFVSFVQSKKTTHLLRNRCCGKKMFGEHRTSDLTTSNGSTKTIGHSSLSGKASNLSMVSR